VRPLQQTSGEEAALAESINSMSEMIGRSNTSIYWVGTERSGPAAALEMGERPLVTRDGPRVNYRPGMPSNRWPKTAGEPITRERIWPAPILVWQKTSPPITCSVTDPAFLRNKSHRR